MNKLNRKVNVVVFVTAVAISLLLAVAIIALTSDNPLGALNELLTGPLKNKRTISLVINSAVPAIFTGLGLSIMFQAQQFNLSPDGIFYFTGAMAAFFAIRLVLPTGIHPLVAILLCGLIGSVISVIPGVLKLKWNANIIVSSLMFNYILLYAGLFVLRNVIRDSSSGNMVSEKMSKTALLPTLFGRSGIHLGFFLALAATAACWIFLYKSKPGYEIRLTGNNPNYAKYTGISVTAAVLGAQLIGGFLAGAGGAIEVMGSYKRFEWLENPGYGWEGFIVATLAQNNPALVPFMAIFLAYLEVGSDIAVRSFGIPPDVIPTIRGIMIVLVAAQNFLSRWKHKQVIKTQEKVLAGEETGQ